MKKLKGFVQAIMCFGRGKSTGHTWAEETFTKMLTRKGVYIERANSRQSIYSIYTEYLLGKTPNCSPPPLKICYLSAFMPNPILSSTM